MTRPTAGRLLLPLLVTGLVIAACGGEEEAPTGTTGGAGSSTSEAESSAPGGGSSPAPEGTEDPTGAPLGSDAVAACTELETIANDITSAFPEGVGLNPGVVPDDEQAGALTALVEEYGAVDVPDEELASLRDGVVAAAETILDRAEAGEAIAGADADAFDSSFADLGMRCQSGS